MRRAGAALATLLVGGALAASASPRTHDGVREIHSWSKAQAAYVDPGPRGLTMSRAPDPPSRVVLIEASGRGALLGSEISALAQHLGRALVEGSSHGNEETLDAFHEVICFAISWLLENRVDPGDPEAMAERINAYLSVRNLPGLDYPRMSEELERLYVSYKRALSTDELAREVAEAILC